MNGVVLMLKRDSSVGRSASAIHKVVGFITFGLSAVVAGVVWFGNG